MECLDCFFFQPSSIYLTNLTPEGSLHNQMARAWIEPGFTRGPGVIDATNISNIKICMYVRTYVCMYASMYVSIYVFIYICTHLPIHLSSYLHVYLCIYVYFHIVLSSKYIKVYRLMHNYTSHPSHFVFHITGPYCVMLSHVVSCVASVSNHLE